MIPPAKPPNIKVRRFVTGINFTRIMNKITSPMMPVTIAIDQTGQPKSIAKLISSTLYEKLPLIKKPNIQVKRLALCRNQNKLINIKSHWKIDND